jgi:hypothetical protein
LFSFVVSLFSKNNTFIGVTLCKGNGWVGQSL